MPADVFVDQAKVYIKAGNGGQGLVTFRREKYVPRGGPSGGDGGNGGDVVFVATPGLRTLLDFRYNQHFTAKNGQPGGPKNQAGRNGEDRVVPVPQGTVVWDVDTGELIADISAPDQREVIARGGRGGRGNARFATSTERAPNFAEKGEPGEERTVRLELKLIADVGLVGLPNAGKSTFLSRVSAARPKIADYPFTTLVPNLGVVAIPGREGETFVLADIPGLIKGAHGGIGLGDKFLRHVERTRVLIHLVDVSPFAGHDPLDAYRDIRHELELYDPALAARPEIVVATKVDVAGAEEGAARLEAALKETRPEADMTRDRPAPVLLRASPLTGQGLTPVLHAAADLLAVAPPAPPVGRPVTGEEAKDTKMGDPRAGGEISPSPPAIGAAARRRRSVIGRGFMVSVEADAFVVRGRSVERTVVRTDLENEEAVRHHQHVLKRRGVFRALRTAGAREGSTVRIGDFEFDYYD